MRSHIAALAPAALLLQGISLPAELLAMAASRVPYDPAGQTISDLAATRCTSIPYPSGPAAVCSPLHTLLNLSWVLGGAALVVAAIGLARTSSPAPRRRRAGAVVLLVVMGLSTVLCGLIPLDVALIAHSLVSLPAILLGPAAAALTLACWWPGAPRGLVPACWVLAVVPTVAALAMLATLDAFGVMGLLERIAVWMPLLALAALGAARLARGRSGLRAAAGP